MYDLQSGFTFETSDGRCVSCHGSGQNFPLVAFVVAIVVFVIVALARHFRSDQNKNASVGRLPIIRFIFQIDKGMVKIILSTFQIVLSISWNLQISFPVPAIDAFTLLGCLPRYS